MWARFFRSDAMVERLGSDCNHAVKREGFQVTYDQLRDLDGEVVADWNHEDSSWWCAGVRFSDFVIVKADPDEETVEVFYDPPEVLTGTVFDPTDETFGPLMRDIQAGDFADAAKRLVDLAAVHG